MIHPPMIGFGTEVLTSEHTMKHHTWTRAGEWSWTW